MDTIIAEVMHRPGDATPARILLVDDDQDIIESIKAVLEIESERYNVRAATNAVEAKNIAREFMPDIALLDIKLGRSSGLDLVPTLKRRVPGIMCIMMTAFRDAKYAVSAVRFGADDYLFKPLEPLILIKTLDQYLEKQRLRNVNAEIERRFRAVFNQSHQFLFLLDTQGRVLEVNNTALEFVGCKLSETVGYSFWDTPWWVHNPEAYTQIKIAVDEARQGNSVHFEKEITNIHGMASTYDVSIKPIFDDARNLSLFICEAHDITRLKEAERQLQLLAYYDSLTGLPNRTLFNEHLKKILAQAIRYQRQFALMFVDLDHFKQVNDTYGHRHGDLVLVEVAEQLKKCTREEDIIARHSGDEFTIILTEVSDPRIPEQVARRITDSIANLQRGASEDLPVTASVGIARYPDDGVDADALMESADSAMYRAKQEGKNCFRFNEPDQGGPAKGGIT